MSRRDIEQLSCFDAVQLRCAKGDRVKSGVGVAGYGVVRVTAVGAQRPEIDVRAAAETVETGYGSRLFVHHRCDTRTSSGVEFEREVMG